MQHVSRTRLSVGVAPEYKEKLSFYDRPPTDTVTLDEFESFAFDRLRGSCVCLSLCRTKPHRRLDICYSISLARTHDFSVERDRCCDDSRTAARAADGATARAVRQTLAADEARRHSQRRHLALCAASRLLSSVRLPLRFCFCLLVVSAASSSSRVFSSRFARQNRPNNHSADRVWFLQQETALLRYGRKRERLRMLHCDSHTARSATA